MKCVTAIRVFIVAIAIEFLTPDARPWQAFAEENESVASGKTLFQEKCSVCHTIGGGRLVGPDLKGVTALRDNKWLEKFISAPDHVLAAGDPVANQLLKEYGGLAMPNLGLSESQVDVLIDFLSEDLHKKTAPVPVPAPASQTTKTIIGDPQRGAALFTGVISFQRGGSPCLACHTVSGVAPLGGGSLGPDLTGIYGQLGAAGLQAALVSLPFPTMQPIYRNQLLTPLEQEDLAALFQAAAGRQPVDAASRIIILAVVGFLLLLFLTGIVWRKRLKSVRQTLVEEMRGDHR